MRDVDIKIGGDVKDLEDSFKTVLKSASGFVKQIQTTFKNIDVFKATASNVQLLNIEIKALSETQATLKKQVDLTSSAYKTADKNYEETKSTVVVLKDNIKILNKEIANSRRITSSSALRKDYEDQGGSVKDLVANIDKLTIVRQKEKLSLESTLEANRKNREELNKTKASLKSSESTLKANTSQIKSATAAANAQAKAFSLSSAALRKDGIDTKNLASEKQRLASSIESANRRAVAASRISNARNIIGINPQSIDRQIRLVRASFDRLRKSGVLSGKDIERAYIAANRRIREIKNSAKQAGGIFRSLTTTAASFFGIFQVARGIGGFVGLVDEFKSINAQIKIATRNNQEYLVAQTEIFEIAKATRTPLNDTAKLYGRIARSTKKLNVTQKEQFAVTTIVNQSILASGANAREAEAAVIQLGQALASGRLSGDELRSIAEQTPRLAQAIADGLGVPIGALKELGKQGKLSSEIVIKALLTQRKVIDDEFAQLPVTVAQSLSNLTTEFTKFAGDFDAQSGFTDSISSSIQAISNNLPTIINSLIIIAKLTASIFAGRLLSSFIVGILNLGRAAAGSAFSFRALGIAIKSLLGGIPGLIILVGSLALAFIDFGDDAKTAEERARETEKAAKGAVDAYKELNTEAAKSSRREQLGKTQRDLADKIKEERDLVTKLTKDFKDSLVADSRSTNGIGLSRGTLRLEQEVSSAKESLADLNQELEETSKTLGKIFSLDSGTGGLGDVLATVAIPETFDKTLNARILSIQNSIKGFAAVIAKRTVQNLDDVVSAVDLRFRKSVDKIDAEIQKVEESIQKIQDRGGKNQQINLDLSNAALTQLRAERNKLSVIISQTKEKEKQVFIDKENKIIEDTSKKLESLTARINGAISGIVVKSASTVSEVMDAVESRYDALKDKANALVLELQKTADIAANSSAFGQESRDIANENVVQGEANQVAIDQLIVKAQALEIVKNLEERLNELQAQRSLIIQEQQALVTAGSITPGQAQENIALATDSANIEMEKLLVTTKEQLATLVGMEQAETILAKYKKGLTDVTEASKIANKANDLLVSGLSDAITGFISGADSAKEAFKKFAADFLTRIAQMILQQQLLNAFGGGGGIGGAIGSFATNHAGGLAGSGKRKLVDPSVFFNAPRYHSGGIAGLAPNEVPSILEKGEEVLTRSDPRHRGNSQEQQPINIINAIDSGTLVEEGLSTPAGERSVLNIVRANRAGFRALLA